MTVPTYVLAIDLGTGGPKVGVVDREGHVVSHGHESVPLILLPGGGAEQDPQVWWQTIVSATRTALDGSDPETRNQVVAVSVTAQWMGTVAVDAEGDAIGNALIWMDARGARYSQQRSGGGIQVPTTGYNARKLKRWLDLTGGVPSRTGKDPVGHILWLRHERPAEYARARAFLDVPDYLNLRLTGRVCAAFDTAVGYWCTDNRDLSAVAYVDELVTQCGLERDRLPQLVPTGSIIGTLSAAAATELGLSTKVEVVTASADTSSAGIGAGAVEDYAAHLYIGTSSWLSCHVPSKHTHIRTNITAIPSAIPHRYWVATEQDVAGKALEWLAAVLGLEGNDGQLANLEDLAREAEPGSGGVLFAPWLNGERTPVEDERLRGMWCNLSLSTARPELVRAVYEGVALNTRWMLEGVERFVHRSRPAGFPSIAFVGGGARSAWWCQVLADVLDRPIRQIREPLHANLRGAAWCAFVARGDLRWPDIPALVDVDTVHQPDAARRAGYDDAYANFRAMYSRTRRLFARLNRTV